MYTLTALFPYVGFMVARFDGEVVSEDSADRAGEKKLMLYFVGSIADVNGDAASRNPYFRFACFAPRPSSVSTCGTILRGSSFMHVVGGHLLLC